MAYIGIGAVFIVLCSWIALPGPVPFTLQTFGVFFVIGFLKGRRSLWAVGVYILMGLVGIPVFSGFTGGAGTLLGATGGFILGFAVAALVCRLTERWWQKGFGVKLASMLLGLVICYGLGTLWYAYVFSAGSRGGFVSALSVCVVPFIVPDIVKVLAAAVLSGTIEKRLKKKRY